MGYDTDRFVEEPRESLCCVICLGVLEDARAGTPPCQHAFCSVCIADWLAEKGECPLCKTRLTVSELQQPHLIVRELLGELKIQ
jgi:hypothetical protein